LAFFSKTNVMINFFQNLALFRVKNANFFAEIFGENILKIITSVPGRFSNDNVSLLISETAKLSLIWPIGF
jgi:hypothetical protein